MPIEHGRDFNSRDGLDAVIIDRTLADLLSPGGDPVSRVISDGAQTYHVIGVLTRKEEALAASNGPISPYSNPNSAVFRFSPALAAFSFRDAARAARGHAQEMTLQLPGQEKSRIRSLIRAVAGSHLMPLWAFLVAFPVALLEFLCTGQTYLPTIVLIIANQGLHSHAVLLLLLYNLLFILPLLVITVLAAAGISSERLRSWFTRHMSASKLLGSLLFALFAVLFLTRWWKGR